jgi:hypothetical protein
MNNRLSRRQLLLRGIQVSAGGVTLAALSACGRGAGSGAASTAGAMCYDSSKVDPSMQSMREALHYTERSPNPATVCPGCTYSTFATPPGMCGTCNIFSGGPVSDHGHCDSWAKRAS